MGDTKKNFTNSIMLQMSRHMDKSLLAVLERTLEKELVRVSMDDIPTLPERYGNDVDLKNEYVIRLFICKSNTKANTKEQYLMSIKRLITLIRKPLPKMDASDISYYMHWFWSRPGKSVAATTWNNERGNISAFFVWMQKEGLVASNPVNSIDPKKVIKKPIDHFRPDELFLLRDACKSKRDRAIIEVLRSTGARVGEIVQVKTEEIDWATGGIMILSEKSDRYRTIYLDHEARWYLKRYLDERTDKTPYLFAQERAPYGPMKTCGIRAALKRIGDRAGIESRVYPHKMRKTLAMDMKRRGYSLGDIQEALGHADPRVTADFYAATLPEDIIRKRERIA